MVDDKVLKTIAATTKDAQGRIEPTLGATPVAAAAPVAEAAAQEVAGATTKAAGKMGQAWKESDLKAGLGSIADSGKPLAEGAAAIAKRVKGLVTGSGDKLGGVAGTAVSAADAVSGKAASIVGGSLKGVGRFATKNPLIAAVGAAVAGYAVVKNLMTKRDKQSELDEVMKQTALKETQLGINAAKNQLAELPDQNPDARAAGYANQVANNRAMQATATR